MPEHWLIWAIVLLAVLFDYINGFYNRYRIHSAINFLSPIQFEKAYIESLKLNPIKLFNEDRLTASLKKKALS